MLQWDVITALLAETFWLLLPLVLAALIVTIHLLARWQTIRRSRVILVALNDSTRGRVVVERPPTGSGFAVHITPAPEPFTHLQIAYQPEIRFNLLGRLIYRQAPRPDRLTFHGTLPALPRQELVWVRGEIPGRALGREANSALWTRHSLDFTRSEYATRGTNPGALMHVFSDLQTRFEPLLYKVAVLTEENPALQLWLRGNGLNAHEIPPLVALTRAAGRAALLE